MKNPLLDQEFLEQLFLYNHREVYAKIVLLTFDELPVKEIQGMITAGSVNVDGNSAVRRTCSLTMITQEGYISDAHWGLRNKIKLEVGLKNFIDENYPDIIWFKQGMFIITSLNESFATNSHQITIQGKDKMCLLNGEVGGNLIASTDFGKLEEYKKDEQGNEYLEYIYLKIKDIIKYAVGTFGMELPHNIIIEDVDDYGKELLEYRGDKPLYLFKNLNISEIVQMNFESEWDSDNYAQTMIDKYESCITQTIDGETFVTSINFKDDSFDFLDLVTKRDFKVDEKGTDYQSVIMREEKAKAKAEQEGKDYNDAKLNVYRFLRYHKLNKKLSKNYDADGNFVFEVIVPELTVQKTQATQILINEGKLRFLYTQDEDLMGLESGKAGSDEIKYSIIKINYGDTAGYRQTDLTYPGDLKANIGESLTSILDKIKQMFGDYEYFYDLDGRFIFQKKKTYINNSWNSLVNDEINNVTYANSAAYSSSVSWRFEDNMLLTAFSNNPNIQNLKNDFAVWGQRQSASGVKLPVHIRYAIQEKPVYYYSDTEKRVFYTKDYAYKNTIEEIDSNIDYIYKTYNSSTNNEAMEVVDIMYPNSTDYAQILLDDAFIDKNGELNFHTIKLNNILVKRDLKVDESTTDYQNKINISYMTGNKLAAKVYELLREHKINKMNGDNYDDNGNFIFGKTKVIYFIGNNEYTYTYVYNQTENNKEKDNGGIYCDIKYEKEQQVGYYIMAPDKTTIVKTKIVDQKKWEDGGYAQQIYNNIKGYDWKGIGNDDPEKWYEVTYEDDFNVWDVLTQRDIIVDETKYDYMQYILDAKDNKYKVLYTILRNHKINKMNGSNYDSNGNYKFESTRLYYDDEQNFIDSSKFPENMNENTNYYLIKKFNNNQNRTLEVDWRELIYQMAVDYYKNSENNNIQDIVLDNGDNALYYPQGITGYEMFYIDMQGFWRQLYNPDARYSETGWVTLPIPGGISDGLYSTDTGWNQNVTEQPENLNFWFDFMSVDSDLGKYSISTIGDRTKVVNDNKVSAIYFKETPLILFNFDSEQTNSSLQEKNPGHTIMPIPSAYAEYFTISGQGQSAQSALTALLNKHAFTIDSTTITSLPVYHLQPNTRIFIKDDNTRVNGEYIVSKITVPLTYNGTMSITATKAVENIY